MTGSCIPEFTTGHPLEGTGDEPDDVCGWYYTKELKQRQVEEQVELAASGIREAELSEDLSVIQQRHCTSDMPEARPELFPPGLMGQAKGQAKV
jgi:hypothetical protein